MRPSIIFLSICFIGTIHGIVSSELTDDKSVEEYVVLKLGTKINPLFVGKRLQLATVHQMMHSDVEEVSIEIVGSILISDWILFFVCLCYLFDGRNRNYKLIEY